MPMLPAMTGRQLRQLRHRLGLTQVQLAARVGVTERTVIRWERDHVRITAPMAKLLQMLATSSAAGS